MLKGCKPYKFELRNYPKLSFTNLNYTTPQKLALQIFEAFIRILLSVNLSLNQTLLTFRLYVRQTWMITLIIFLQSEKIMHGLAVYVKNGLISRKLCGFLFSTGFTSSIVLLIFLLLITFFTFMHGF